MTIDPAGTPLAMTNSSGTVVWKVDYKPFGEEQSVTQSPENVMKFVGKEKDKETGLYYFGARYMEPMIGRFISPDPVGAVDPKTGKINQMIIQDPQRINVYAYGLNNPYKYIDSSGELAFLAIPLALGAKEAFVAIAVGATVFLNSPAGVEFRNEIGRSLESLGDALSTDTYFKSKPGSKPKDVPTGTKPIDQQGLSKDDIHKIKEGVGARPRDWVGITPDGDVITGNEHGKAENHGLYKDYLPGSKSGISKKGDND